MKRLLFVTNGHGEIAVAARLAREVQSRRPVACDHLALVGDFAYPSTLREVGPRRRMPSGGVIAMGNVRNILRDVRAGLLSHTLAQLRFLRETRGAYDAAVAVGDVFSLAMALQARATATVFVGTAKSVYVAPYGRFEERIVRKADRAFVRDAATARRLRLHGIDAVAANAIVDLYAEDAEEVDVAFDPALAVFPGSRDPAYDDACTIARVVAEIAQAFPNAGALLSIAPGIDPQRLAERLSGDGWNVVRREDRRAPFSLRRGNRELLRAWSGSPSAILRRACVALGQAGTANEAAAALGIPVVAFARTGERRTPWYRMRQIGLLDGAMMVTHAEPRRAASDVAALLRDPARMRRMAHIGRERMGPAGAAARIAAEIAALAYGE